MAALSLDTMTDPKYSGQGIFSNAAETLYASQKKAMVLYMASLIAILSMDLKNLNWQQIMCAPVHIRPIHCTRHILERLRKRIRNSPRTPEVPAFCHKTSFFPQNSGACELNVESEFGNWVDDLWLRCRSQHRSWVIRDKTYLNCVT